MPLVITMASDQDRLIAEIHAKLNREQTLIQGTSKLRDSTSNPVVKESAGRQIHEAQKNIKYLEDKLRTLQIQMQPNAPPPPQHGGSMYNQQQGRNMAGSPGPPLPPKDNNLNYGGGQHGDYPDPNQPHYPQSGAGSMPSGAPAHDPRPFQPIPKARPNFSKLGRGSYVHLQEDSTNSYQI